MLFEIWWHEVPDVIQTAFQILDPLPTFHQYFVDDLSVVCVQISKKFQLPAITIVVVPSAESWRRVSPRTITVVVVVSPTESRRRVPPGTVIVVVIVPSAESRR